MDCWHITSGNQTWLEHHHGWFDDFLGYKPPFSFRLSQLAMFGSGLIQGTKIHVGFAGDSGPPNSKVVSPCTKEIQV
jgi:hypothetical protein